MTLKIFFIITFFPVYIYSAFEKIEVGAESQALGNACVALVGSPYALYYNPANINQDKGFQCAFSYQNFYGIPDINLMNMTTNFMFKKIPFSFGINRFGNNLYQELYVSIGSSYKINKDASIGICIQYYSLQINRYGQQSTWGLNTGLKYCLAEDFNIGFHVTNVNQPELGTVNEKLPQCFSLGFGYKAIPRLIILGEFFRDVSFDQDYRAGILYTLSEQFFLRVGTIDKCNMYNLGCGFILKNISFDYALLNHQVLGVSHSLSIIFNFINAPDKKNSN